MLDARTRELDALETLGREAAAALDAPDLFRAVARVLDRWLPLDLLAIVDIVDGPPRGLLLEGRAHSSDWVDHLRAFACRALGRPEPTQIEWRREALEHADPELPLRDEWHEGELIAVPVVHRSVPRAYVLIHAGPRVGEAQLRLLYAAGNQLSLHLERILSTRAAESTRRLAILESMPQAVCLVDRTLAVVESNDAARDLLASAGGRGLCGVVEDHDLGPDVERIARGERAALSVELTVGRARCNLTVSPFLSPGGELDGLVFVFTDVTPQRRLQQQLAQAEKLSGLGQLISGVAHELNNPLSAVLCASQLVGRGLTDERGRRRLKLLEDEVRRCQKIVGNLLTFARSRGPSVERISLPEVVRSVLALMQYAHGRQNVRIETSIDRDVPAIVADGDRLRQVVLNLVGNARQALGDAGGTICLAVRAAGTDEVLLEVRDDGPGIPADVRERIFEPFFTTKPEGEGTGLGLSIVADIVTDHRGRIEADCPSDGGTRIRVHLPVRGVAADAPAPTAPESSAATTAAALEPTDPAPLARPPGPPPVDVPPDPAPGVSAPSGHVRSVEVALDPARPAPEDGAPLAASVEPDPPLAGRTPGPGRLLLVEREAPLARLIADGLEEDGWQVETVADVESARLVLTERPFQVLVADESQCDAVTRARLTTIDPGHVGRWVVVGGAVDPDDPGRESDRPLDLAQLRHLVGSPGPERAAG